MHSKILGRDPLMRFFEVDHARGQRGIGAAQRERGEDFFFSRRCEGRKH